MGAQDIANSIAGLFTKDAEPKEDTTSKCPNCGHSQQAQTEDEPISKKINSALGVGDPKAAF